MFGYLKVDLPNVYMKDTVLYKATYCGLCKGIGKCCGQRARLTLSYDLTFLSVLLHNVCNKDLQVKMQRCVIHRIRKRPIAEYDELTGRIATLNVILSFYKLSDDIIDSGKGRLKKGFFASAYKKAKKLEPEMDKIVKERYTELRELEKKQSCSIDIVSDTFGRMLKELVKVLSVEFYDDNLGELAYNLGKWIYLLDALDDFEKDIKKSQYNVLINSFSDCKTKKQLLEKHGKDLIFIFATMISVISDSCKKLKYNFNHDLTDNILLLGLKCTLKEIMEDKKCKKTIRF